MNSKIPTMQASSLRKLNATSFWQLAYSANYDSIHPALHCLVTAH